MKYQLPVSAKKNVGSRRGRGPAVRWGGFFVLIQVTDTKKEANQFYLVSLSLIYIKKLKLRLVF